MRTATILHGKLVPVLLQTAGPISAGMLFHIVYNMVDAIFISLIDTSDPSYMGGIGMVFPFIFFVMAFSNGFMIGTSSVTARAVGAGEKHTLHDIAGTGLISAGLFSSIFVLIVYLAGEGMMRLFGAEGDYAAHGLEYIRYLIPGVLLLFLHNILSGALQGEGLSRYMMWAMIIGTVLNILLDPLFIFVLGLEVRGAALATVISQAASFLYVLRLFLKGRTVVTLSMKLRHFNPAVLRKIAVVGFPQSISMLVTSFTILVINRIALYIDPLVVTAFTTYSRFEGLLVVPINGMGSALIAVIGQNYGRKNLRRCHAAWRYGYLLALGGTALLLGIFLLAAPAVFGGLSSIEQVVAYTLDMTKVLGLGLVLAIFGILSQSVFQAVGAPLPALGLTRFRVFVCIIPMMLIGVFVLDMGFRGLLIGFLSGDIGSSVFSYIVVERYFRKRMLAAEVKLA